MSQENSRFASTLNVNGTTYAYYPVSAVAGSEQLPYSLTVLLENVLRNAETRRREERPRASWKRGARASWAARSSSRRRACCSRISRACPCSWTSP